MSAKTILLAAALIVSVPALADTAPGPAPTLRCSGYSTEPRGFVGGLELAPHRHPLFRTFVGTMHDNFISADILCRQPHDSSDYECVGMWDDFDGHDPLTLKIRTVAPGEYKLDLLKRSRVYGGGELRDFDCKTR